MRTFKHGNWSHKDKCLICGKAGDGEVVLIGIDGTEDGGNMRAAQVHVDCIELRFNADHKLLYQRIE